MSLAPASSLGAFLKARLAVNGIQCAARSFGTLTEGATGLLSSMGDLVTVFRALEHDPEKSLPRTWIAEWGTGFPKDHAQTTVADAQTISFVSRRKRQSPAIFAAWVSGFCTGYVFLAQILSRDRRRRSRTPRLRSLRCRARAAAIVERRPPAGPVRARSRTAVHPAVSGVRARRSGCV